MDDLKANYKYWIDEVPKFLDEMDICNPISFDMYLDLLRSAVFISSLNRFDGDIAKWQQYKEDYDTYLAFSAWLQKTDILHAPFSNTHYNYKHGLITYLTIVAQNILKLHKLDMFSDVDLGKALFCALTHRIDKVNRYTYSFGSGNTVSSLRLAEGNIVAPFGRGVGSIVILSKFFPLSTDDELAIRWAGGAWFEDQTNYNDLNIASKHKLVKILQFAVSLAFS